MLLINMFDELKEVEYFIEIIYFKSFIMQNGLKK